MPMITRCKNCNTEYPEFWEYCPKCGQKRATAVGLWGWLGALILLLLAVGAVRYVVSEINNAPTVDPASLRKVTRPQSDSQEPQDLRFR